MKRVFLLTAAGLTLVALAGAVGLPDLAGAQDAPGSATRSPSGVGSVDAVPNEAQMSFGVETRRPTAQAAVAANADAMRRSSTRFARPADASSRRSGSASTRTRTRPAPSTATRRRTASRP